MNRGLLDDLLVRGIGVGLLVKLTPAGVLNEQLERFEAPVAPTQA